MRRVSVSAILAVSLSCLPPAGLFAGALSSPALAASAAAPTGHLLVIGGNGTTPDIVEKALQAGGGSNGVVAVFPQASELPETGREAVATWKSAGFARAVELDPKDPSVLKTVREATFIWFPGGDQSKLMGAFKGTGLPELIRARYMEGALVGGTSAGAAVMSALMLTGNADLQGIAAGATELVPGLSLWPEVIVDQHFLKRQRNNRLIAAVLDHPDLVGVGIDEKTAVFVSGRRFEVLGANSVVIVDARRARVDRVPAGSLATARGVRLSVLKAGMKYDLDRD